MPGIGSLTNDTATTPNRKTHIVFDVDELVPQQPAWAIERSLEAINPVYDESEDTTTNVEFVPGLGYRLAAVQNQAWQLHENGAPIIDMIVPIGYNQQPTWVQSNQPGVTYLSGVTASGDQFYNRQVAAGDSIDNGNYNLVDDQTAYPSPLLGISNAPMYRVGVDNMAGRLSTAKEINWSFQCRGNPKSANDYVSALYFDGPLGWDPNPDGYQGTGYYYAAFRGDGRMELSTKLNNGSAVKWVIVRTAWYCDPSQVMNRVHRVVILPVAGTFPQASGGFIYFRFTNSGQKIGDPATGSFMTVIGRNPSDNPDVTNFHFKYTAPGVYGNPSPPTLPARVETRQDLDVAWQVAATEYQTSGFLLDQPFQVPFYTSPGIDPGSGEFTVEWWGNIPPQPPGLPVYNLVPVMFGLDTPDSGNPTRIPLGGVDGDFTPLDGTYRFYQVGFVFTGKMADENGNDTPVLEGYRVFRNGIEIIVSPGPFQPAFASDMGPKQLRTSAAVQPVSVTIADNDPTTASASCLLDDFAGEMPRLQARGDFPAIIYTDFKLRDGVPRTTIYHRGYARIPESEEIGNHEGGGWHTGFSETGALQNFNYGERFKINCEFTGAWQRLSEALMPVRWNFENNATQSATGDVTFPKVTDALRQLFYFAGYGDDQLLIPDLSIRLFPTSDKDSLAIEPDSSIQELIIRWARDYLGAYLYFEPNYGSYGKWCVLEQLVEPYTFLCAFTTAGPGAGKVQNSINSYPPTVIGGQSMPQCPILKGGLRWVLKPPEGNYIIGVGTQENDGGDSAGLMVQLAFNPSSFRFAGFPDAPPPDPNGIDWLARPRPIKVYLPSYAASNLNDLSSPMNFATRRVYNIGCHGRLQKRFISPVVIIKDPLFPTIYRPLRFYDPVYVNGDPCLVRNVQMHYDKDDHQFASYLVEKLIDGVPPQVSRVSNQTAVRSAVKSLAMGVISESTTTSRHLAGEKRMYGQGASTLTIGALKVAPIQDSSGAFVFMLDFDTLG